MLPDWTTREKQQLLHKAKNSKTKNKIISNQNTKMANEKS